MFQKMLLPLKYPKAILILIAQVYAWNLVNFPFVERSIFRFVKALTVARNDLEHATCPLRGHRSREPPPYPING